MDVQRVSAVIESMWRTVGRESPSAAMREAPGLLAVTTGVPLPTMNGVWSFAASMEASAASAMASFVEERGVPWCIQARPGADAMWQSVADQAGLVTGPTIPLMVTDAVSLVEPASNLEVVRLEETQLASHIDLGSVGFGMPADAYRKSMLAISCLPGQRFYLGLVDGEPVTTAVTIPTGDQSIGVFNVATPEQHRGHGYGAAITAAAVHDGLSSGARWAWLQSSPEGYRVYQRIGFTTLEEWSFWLTP